MQNYIKGANLIQLISPTPPTIKQTKKGVNNMICYENVNIYEVDKREGEYNDKKKKYIKFAKPKITKKLIFEDCYSSLEELSNEIRHAVMRGSGDKIEVSFEAKMEY